MPALFIFSICFSILSYKLQFLYYKFFNEPHCLFNSQRRRIDAQMISSCCSPRFIAIIIIVFRTSLIRFFDLRFFSLPAKGRDKIVWSVRFRRARRTIVRRAAKSGAEKAKTLNFMQESVRIPTP